MSKRTIAFVVFAFVVAAGCVRLGIWQLDRLRERRARNAPLQRTIAAPLAPLAQVLAEPGPHRLRRVTVTGEYDFANEVVLAGTSHEGSPGVHFVTPLRAVGTDTAIMVNRGWAYAPDAMRVDASRWREPSRVTVRGYLEDFAGGPPRTVTSTVQSRVVRRLDRDSIARLTPYPIAPYVLVALSAEEQAGQSTPVRLSPPPLDEGPHRSYAIQWFAFAIIAVVGSIAVARQQRTRSPASGAPDAPTRTRADGAR